MVFASHIYSWIIKPIYVSGPGYLHKNLFRKVSNYPFLTIARREILKNVSAFFIIDTVSNLT